MEHQIIVDINEDSILRKNPYSSPVEALHVFLGYFWVDRYEEEALEQWTTYVQESARQARVLLKNLSALCNDPPPDLPEILQEDGWICLLHYKNGAVPTVYSFSEHVEWLRELIARLRCIYEEENFSPAGVLRTILPKIWLDKSDYEAQAEWQRYVKQCPRQAKFVLEKLAALTLDPPPDLPQILQKYGWIHLYHNRNGSGPIEYSFSEHVEWVRQMTAQFRCIYEKEVCPSPRSYMPV